MEHSWNTFKVGIHHPERNAKVRRTAVRVTVALAAVLFALGLTASAAQAAKPRDIEIGPVTVCNVVTFFDIVIFEWNCTTGG